MSPSSSEADNFMNLSRDIFELGFPFEVVRAKKLYFDVYCPNAACFEATLDFASKRNMDVSGIEGGLRLVPPPMHQPATNFP
jgi:hypothetical protein